MKRRNGIFEMLLYVAAGTTVVARFKMPLDFR